MKLYTLFIGLLLGATTLSFAQENPAKYPTQYEVQYDAVYSKDTLNLADKTQEVVYLYTGKKYGVFMNANEANKEAIMARMKKAMRTSGSIEIPPRSFAFKKMFYKNLQNNQVLTVAKIAGKQYSFQEPALPLHWQLKDSAKTLLGYTVHKATTHFAGRDYVAWFTLKVPIHDGPYVFCGLPGLIVQLYDTEHQYQFTLKSLKKLEQPKIWTFPETDKVAKKKYTKMKAKAEKNKRGILSLSVGNYKMTTVKVYDANGREISPAELRHKTKERKKHKNNPIERKE